MKPNPYAVPQEPKEPQKAEVKKEDGPIKKFFLRVLSYLVYAFLLLGFFAIVHVGLLQSLKVRTGFDAGLGWLPLTEFQESLHHEIDPVNLLISCGYSGKYVPQGAKESAPYGSLILGDTLLLNQDDEVIRSLYDKDFEMDTLTMFWVDVRSCKIMAAINPAYIIYGVSLQDIRTIVGIIKAVYNYESVKPKYFSTWEDVEGGV